MRIACPVCERPSMIDLVFARDALAPALWKNGGGTTREIAVSAAGQPYWRLSIADVSADGAFSIFEGLERILTVIEGAGMVLSLATRDIAAPLQVPIRFSGAERITGLLPHGPIQDFNVMFDPAALTASVGIPHGDAIAAAGPSAPAMSLIYCLRGLCRTAGGIDLPPHTGILAPSGAVCAATRSAVALRVDISRA